MALGEAIFLALCGVLAAWALKKMLDRIELNLIAGKIKELAEKIWDF